MNVYIITEIIVQIICLYFYEHNFRSNSADRFVVLFLCDTYYFETMKDNTME